MATHNVLIASPALSDAALLSAAIDVSSMPPSNLLTMQPYEVWRTLTPAAASLVFDLQSAQTINLVALLFTNASATATWRIRGATSEANLTAAPGYDSGALTIWPVGVPGAGLSIRRTVDAIKFLAAAGGPGAQTFRWWRIDIADAANPSGWFQAGRVYIAAANQPQRNLAYGWGIRPVAPALRRRSAGGQLHVVSGARGGRVLRFELRWMTEAEAMGWLFDLAQQRGSSRDVLAIRDPDRPELFAVQAVYGLMGEPDETRHIAHPIYGRAFEIELLAS